MRGENVYFLRNPVYTMQGHSYFVTYFFGYCLWQITYKRSCHLCNCSLMCMGLVYGRHLSRPKHISLIGMVRRIQLPQTVLGMFGPQEKGKVSWTRHPNPAIPRLREQRVMVFGSIQLYWLTWATQNQWYRECIGKVVWSLHLHIYICSGDRVEVPHVGQWKPMFIRVCEEAVMVFLYR
jgi:hypothetical protein